GPPQCDRKALQPADDEAVVLPLELIRQQFQAFSAPVQVLEGNLRLQLSQHPAQASVHPVAERKVSLRAASDIELVRPIEHFGVAVRGAETEENLIAFPYLLPADFDLARRKALG